MPIGPENPYCNRNIQSMSPFFSISRHPTEVAEQKIWAKRKELNERSDGG